MTSVHVELTRPVLDTRGMVLDYWRPRRVVWLVVALGVVLRGWVAAAGFLYGDDYVFQGRAWQLPFTADYLLHPSNGHLMPGAFAVQWVMTRAAPMSPVPLALLETLVSAVVVILFARLALRIWGARWAVLVPVSIVALTPLTLPSTTWWAAALNFLPFQLALVVSLGAAVTWWRTRRTWHLWVALLVWLPLLSFSEKVVLVPWMVLASVAVLDVNVGPLRAWGRALRAAPALWLSYLAITAAYVVAYLHLVGLPGTSTPSAAQLAEVLGRGTVTTVAPGLLGGPLDWVPVGDGLALAQPPAWLVIVAVELLAILVVTSVAVSVRARRAWVLAGLFLVADLLLLAFGRPTAFVDPSAALGFLRTADATIPLALAVGVALVAVAPRLSRLLVAGGASTRRARIVLRVGAVAMCLGIALLSVVSSSRYREIWRANASEVFVTWATIDLAAVKDGPPVIDQPVPASVLSPLAFPYNQISWLLAPVQSRPDFGDPTSAFRMFDDGGRLTAGTVVGPAARPGPVGGCGWFEIGAGTPIQLQSDVVDFSHTVRMGYLASGDGSAMLALGDGPARKIELLKGSHEVVLTLAGGGDRVLVSGLTPGVGFCTDDVQVGQAKAVTP